MEHVVYPIGTLTGSQADAANAALARSLQQTKYLVVADVLTRARRERRSKFEVPTNLPRGACWRMGGHVGRPPLRLRLD